MFPNHERTINRLAEHFRDDPRFLAVIGAGSVAKGWAMESSDVDIMLLATDEEFARRAPTCDYLLFTRDFCDYEGGYVDGKIIDMAYLEEVADHGNEPSRAAFMGAFVICSRVPGLQALLDKIPVYDASEREAKMKAFYSQVLMCTWFVGEAEKRRDTYLMMRFVSDLVLFGGRLILAYNYMLYPYHKWFLRQVERAPEKPDNFMGLIDALLKNPCVETANAFRDAISAYRDWGVTFAEASINFTKDREWNWRGQKVPLHDW